MSLSVESLTDSLSIDSLIKEMRSLISNNIKEFFLEENLDKSLKVPAQYFFNPPGKLLRPLICLTFSKDLGFSDEKIASDILPFASALEVIHVSTLIHDDLPALDNDDERRGVKSCHVKFDEATAVLTGDILIALSLNIVKKSTLSINQKYKCNYILTDAFKDVCVGQKLDIENKESKTKINKYKTGSLFSASFLLPLVAYTDSESAFSEVKNFSLEFGNFYQLVDDFIDVYGNKESRGREKSSDIRNLKDTSSIRQTKEETLNALKITFKDLNLKLNELEKVLSKTSTTTTNLVYTRLLAEKIFNRI